MGVCALLGTLEAEVVVFRPLYPISWGVRTGLVGGVPVPEMGDVIFLHLSSWDQKKKWKQNKSKHSLGSVKCTLSKQQKWERLVQTPVDPAFQPRSGSYLPNSFLLPFL